MSEEILPKSKSTNPLSNNFHKTFNQNPYNPTSFTKVTNPLHKYKTDKNNLDPFDHPSTTCSAFHSRKSSNLTVEKQNSINPNAGCQELKLKNPKFQFCKGDLNSSSDVSFMNNSFQDCREEIQQRIAQKFHNSKHQLEDLIHQSPSKNRKVHDRRQSKREKLGFYHCDEIVIRPALSIKPVKVLDLAICPTKNTKLTQLHENNLIEISSSEYVEKPFYLNKITNGSQFKKTEKKLLDLINESPLENSKSYNPRHFVIDSPSFFQTEDDEKKISKSAKQINQERQDIVQNVNFKHTLMKKEENFETKSNSSQASKSSVIKSLTNLYENRENEKGQNMEDNQGNLPFKKRNKIFGNDKKYGLKLSRAIQQEAELERLEGELGVDVFHIVFESDELLKQCCT